MPCLEKKFLLMIFQWTNDGYLYNLNMKLNTKRLNYFKNKVNIGDKLTNQQALEAFYVFSATYFPLSANLNLFKRQPIHPFFEKVRQNYYKIQQQYQIKGPQDWKKQIFQQKIRKSEKQYKSYSNDDWRTKDRLKQKVLINYFCLQILLVINEQYHTAKEILLKQAHYYTSQASLGYFYNCLAKNCLQISQFEQAINYAQEAIKSEQQNLSFYCLKGQIYKDCCRFEEALKIYQKILTQKNPNSKDALSGIAACLYKLQKYDETYQFLIKVPVLYQDFIYQFLQILNRKKKVTDYQFMKSIFANISLLSIREQSNNQRELKLLDSSCKIQQSNQIILKIYDYERCMQEDDYDNALRYLRELLLENAFEYRIYHYYYEFYIHCRLRRKDLIKQVYQIFGQIQQKYPKEQSHSKTSEHIEKKLQFFINYFIVSICYLTQGKNQQILRKGCENMSKIFTVMKILKKDRQSGKSSIIDKVISAVCAFKDYKNVIHNINSISYILQYFSWLKDQDKYDRNDFVKLISLIKKNYGLENIPSYQQIFVQFYTQQLKSLQRPQNSDMLTMISQFFLSQIMRIDESQGIKIYKYLEKKKEFQTSNLGLILKKYRVKDMKYLHYFHSHFKQILTSQQQQENFYKQFFLEKTINSLNQFLIQLNWHNRLMMKIQKNIQYLEKQQSFIMTTLKNGHRFLPNQYEYLLSNIIKSVSPRQYLNLYEIDLKTTQATKTKKILQRYMIRLEIIKIILGYLSPYFEKDQIQGVKVVFFQIMKDRCDWNKIDQCLLKIVGQDYMEEIDQQDIVLQGISHKKQVQLLCQKKQVQILCQEKQVQILCQKKQVQILCQKKQVQLLCQEKDLFQQNQNQQSQSQMVAPIQDQQYLLRKKQQQLIELVDYLCRTISTYSLSLIFTIKFPKDQLDLNDMKIRPRLKFLLIKNYYLIINYLTMFKKSYPKHLIRFYNSKQWSHHKQLAFSKLNFDVIMENGEQIPQKIQIQYGKDRDIQMKMFILSKGKLGFYQFIIQFAKGILQLQQLGLFHMDLAFRNMVYINEILKIIDFDRSLKIKLNDRSNLQQQTLLMHTKAICEYLLDFYFKGDSYDITPDLIYIRINHPKQQNSLNRLRQKIKKGLANISSVNRRADYYFEFLEEYSKQFHLFNYCRLVKQLIEMQQISKIFLSMEQRQYLLIKLDLLGEGQINYNNFISNINDLKDCDKDEKLSKQLVKDLLYLNPNYKEPINDFSKQIKDLNISQLFVHAKICIQRQNYLKAYQSYQMIISKQPTNGQAHLQLAYSMLLQQNQKRYTIIREGDNYLSELYDKFQRLLKEGLKHHISGQIIVIAHKLYIFLVKSENKEIQQYGRQSFRSKKKLLIDEIESSLVKKDEISVLFLAFFLMFIGKKQKGIKYSDLYFTNLFKQGNNMRIKIRELLEKVKQQIDSFERSISSKNKMLISLDLALINKFLQRQTQSNQYYRLSLKSQEKGPQKQNHRKAYQCYFSLHQKYLLSYSPLLRYLHGYNFYRLLINQQHESLMIILYLINTQDSLFKIKEFNDKIVENVIKTLQMTFQQMPSEIQLLKHSLNQCYPQIQQKYNILKKYKDKQKIAKNIAQIIVFLFKPQSQFNFSDKQFASYIATIWQIEVYCSELIIYSQNTIPDFLKETAKSIYPIYFIYSNLIRYSLTKNWLQKLMITLRQIFFHKISDEKAITGKLIKIFKQQWPQRSIILQLKQQMDIISIGDKNQI